MKVLTRDFLKRKRITYDTHLQTWHLPTTGAHPEQKKTIYWGAKKVSLSIAVGRNSTTSASRMLQMNAYINFSHQKPIVGPLVGILTVRGKKHHFSGNVSNFVDIMNTGKKLGAIVFLFTPESINWSDESVEGYLFHSSSKKWIQCTFPLPNVVYNRIPNRSYERKPYVRECITTLNQVPGVTMFNPHFFDKEELFRLLEQSPSISTFLPHSTLLQSMEDLKKMIEEHEAVYLKPTNGKAGSGILKIQLDKGSKKAEYQLLYQTRGKPVMKRFRNLQQLWWATKKQMISSPYVVQQAIPLAKYNDRPFDTRTLVQKNEQGSWEVTGIGVRVAGENRITTHVPQGGRIDTPENVLVPIFSAEKAKKIIDHIKQLAISIAIELEEHYGILGEMSMDFGIEEESGQLWFFEANSKPMKFDEPTIRSKSLSNLIKYSQHLTFGKGGA
jgi:hypothetical protein